MSYVVDVSYVVEVHPPVDAQIEALPVKALRQLAEVFAVLEMVPWSGDVLGTGRPDAPVRNLTFGSGMVTYLILEDQQIVDVLDVQWVDLGSSPP